MTKEGARILTEAAREFKRKKAVQDRLFELVKQLPDLTGAEEAQEIASLKEIGKQLAGDQP